MRPGLRLPALAALALVGFGSWWWLGEQRQADEAVAETRHPDAWFRALDVTQHDAAGRPEMNVRAAYAEHFENEPWIHLRELRATGLAEGPDWTLAANEGRLRDDGVLLEARGDVRLGRTGDAAGNMQLQTEWLNVNTETEIAETDAPVTITHGDGKISGKGLWASLADDYLRLEADVEARYGK